MALPTSWIIDRAEGACACGCLEATARTFRPGHDARLKSMLVRAHVLGVSIHTRWFEITERDPAVGGGVAPVLDVNRQYLNSVYAPAEYGKSVLSDRGFSALYKSMFHPTYHPRYRPTR